MAEIIFMFSLSVKTFRNVKCLKESVSIAIWKIKMFNWFFAGRNFPGWIVSKNFVELIFADFAKYRETAKLSSFKVMTLN